MSNVVFELFAKLGLDSSEYEKGLNNAKGLAETIGGGIKTAFGIGAKAIGAATAAVGAFGLASVKGYAEYEQLVGGVDKLYGEASGKLQQYANEAYKTSGMSANAYMETATSFSAALVNSLSGDVNKAADMTDVAMRAISDNVNTFGSDMGSVTNAFQGFAKQNYTMLDNLKLGYGGTKEEMQRLLEEAGKIAIEQGKISESAMHVVVNEKDVEKATKALATAQSQLESKQNAVTKAQLNYENAIKKNGEGSIQAQKAALALSEANKKLEEASKKAANAGDALATAQKGVTTAFDINNFSDVIQAIEIIQKNQNIAGTTAKEAMKTIEGSAAATKAAWQNVITAIAGGGDLTAAFNGLISSIFGEKEGEGFLSQIIPRIETTMDGIGTFIENSAPYIVEKLPALLDSILPSALQSGVQLIGAVGQGIINSIPTLASAAAQIVVTIVQGLIKAIPNLANGAITLITALGQALYDNSGTLLDSGAQLLQFIWDGIQNNLTSMVESGSEIIGNLANGVLENLPHLIEAGLHALMEFSGTLRENAGLLVDAALDLIVKLADGLIEALPVMIETVPTIVSNIAGIINDNAPKLIATGIELIGKLVKGILEAVPTIIAEFPKIIKAIVDVIVAFNWVNLGKHIITFITNGIKNLSAQAPKTIGEIGKKAFETFKSIDWHNLGRQVINFVVNGLKGLATSIPNALLAIGKSALTVFLKINWLELGGAIVSGIINGLSDGASMIWDAVKGMASNIWDGITSVFEIHSPSKKMMWVGKMIDEGMAKGIEDSAKLVDNAMQDLYVTPSVDAEQNAGVPSNNNNVIINVYGAVGQDVSELADIVADRLNFVTNQQMMAWS